MLQDRSSQHVSVPNMSQVIEFEMLLPVTEGAGCLLEGTRILDTGTRLSVGRRNAGSQYVE